MVFSGDLGRPDHPLLLPPDPIGEADHVVVESTYGDRLHDDGGAAELRPTRSSPAPWTAAVSRWSRRSPWTGRRCSCTLIKG